MTDVILNAGTITGASLANAGRRHHHQQPDRQQQWDDDPGGGWFHADHQCRQFPDGAASAGRSRDRHQHRQRREPFHGQRPARPGGQPELHQRLRQPVHRERHVHHRQRHDGQRADADTFQHRAGRPTLNTAIGDGALGGKLALTVNNSGAGVTTLGGADTYSGSTTVSAGTLDLSNGLALQNSTLTTGGTGIVFDQSVGSSAFTFGSLAGSGNLALASNAICPRRRRADDWEQQLLQHLQRHPERRGQPDQDRDRYGNARRRRIPTPAARRSTRAP